MTYTTLKRLIDLERVNGKLTNERKEELFGMMDVFLLNKRITEEQYSELALMLNAK